MMTLAGAKLGELIVCETLARTVGSCNVLPTISLPFHAFALRIGPRLLVMSVTRKCAFKNLKLAERRLTASSHMRRSRYQGHSIPLALRVRTSSLRRHVSQLK